MANKIIVKSFLWTALESYSSQGIAFIVSIFMARVLAPADYGIIGIIGVFLALSDIFIDSGFSNALINKQNCTKADFSTVFYTNIVISLVFFAILFFCAPLIASFYKNPVLVWTTRAMALTFVISSFGAVSMTILTKELRFKAKAMITFIVSCISGFIGIYLAYNGWGVWALVWQAVISCAIRVVVSVVYVRWKPILKFSRSSFVELFKFGSNLLGSNILFTLYNNAYSLVIGKAFNATQLGYFSRAEGYAKLIPSNISGILTKIMFPILSKIKDNDEELIRLHHLFIIVTSAFIFPGCLFLAGLASPLIYLLITEKWMPVVPLLQILCFAGILDHFGSINSNFILSKGKSNFFLRMSLFTRPIGLIILALSLIFNLQIVALGKVFYGLICVGTSYYFLRKVLVVRLRRGLKDLIIMLFLSGTLSVGCIILFKHISYSWSALLITFTVICLMYIIGLYYLCPDVFVMLKHLVRIRKHK